MGVRTVFKTPWFSIEEIVSDAAHGAADAPYYAIRRGNGVIGFVLTNHGEVVLARQFRPSLGRNTLEMPAGGIEAGETPEVAIAREVYEETGYKCQVYVRVAECRLMLNRDSAVEHFFIGLGAVRQENFVAREKIDVCVLPRDEFRALIRAGDFEQTVALGGLWLAEERFSFRFFDDAFSKVEQNIRQTDSLP